MSTLKRLAKMQMSFSLLKANIKLPDGKIGTQEGRFETEQ
jgi:hypothetical protein